jgi:hypothetical protein
MTTRPTPDRKQPARPTTPPTKPAGLDEDEAVPSSRAPSSRVPSSRAPSSRAPSSRTPPLEEGDPRHAADADGNESLARKRAARRAPPPAR